MSKFRKNNSKKIFSFELCAAKKSIFRSFLLLMASIFSSGLHATPYYWFTAGVIDVHPGDITGSSPGGVCFEKAKYVALYYQRAWNTAVQGEGSLGKPGKTHMYCNIKLTHKNGTSTQNPASIFRGGDECLAGSYNPHDFKCTTGSLRGSPTPPCGAAGNQVNMLFSNPIDFTTGNKIQQEIDLLFGSAPVVVRTYNSMDGRWRHGYSALLNIFDNQSAVLILPSGKEIPYNTYWTPARAEIVGAGRLQRKDTGWIYVDFDNSQYFFDAAGAYIGGIDAYKNIYSISREGARLNVNYPRLGQFSLDFDNSGNLNRLITSDYTVSYQYDQERLVGVTKQYVDKTLTRSYHYEDSRDIKRLTGITDERGVRYATWTYDEQGRAISSVHADGADNSSIHYQDDGAVTLTNSLGKKATYRFTTILGSKRVTSIVGEPSSNCPGANSTFEYDVKGLVTKKVDDKGIITKYTYDSDGREFIRAEAVGTPQERKITTYWHSYLFLPTQIDNGRDSVSYRYDSKGNLISKQFNY